VLTIHQANGDEHREVVRDLFAEYLHAVCPVCNRPYDVGFDAEAILEQDMTDLGVFQPPEGRLLLAYEGEGVSEDVAAAGIACVRTIGGRTAEIKRMYVCPALRRRGIGRALVDAVVEEMRAAGCARLRLDSARFMADAHSFYRAAGFREIEPHPESDVPPAFHAHWVFMELPLGEDRGSVP